MTDPEHWTHEGDEAKMMRYHDPAPERDRPSRRELAEDEKYLAEQSRNAAAETATERSRGD